MDDSAERLDNLKRHDVVDLISSDSSGNVFLSIAVAEPWGEHGKLLPDLQEKVNTCIGLVESGQLAERFGEVTGKVYVEIRHAHAPGPMELRFFSAIEPVLRSVDLELRCTGLSA